MKVRWSKEASGNGMASADASTRSTRSPKRVRAPASMPGLWSSPVTRKPRARSASATSPVPVATSRTCPPSRGRRSTMNRRQRGSWPNESSAPIRSYLGPSGANSSCAWRLRAEPADIGLSWHGGPRRGAPADRVGGRAARRRTPADGRARDGARSGRPALPVLVRGRGGRPVVGRARRGRHGRA